MPTHQAKAHKVCYASALFSTLNHIMKPIALLILTNLGVMAVLALILKIFGIDHMLAQNGMNHTGFLLFACIYGFAGSFISLMMSKSLAKTQMNVQIITQPSNATERWLVETITQQAQRSGITPPEVGIFDHPAPNAFATGANKNNALIAVSTGLLTLMDKNEVEAVLGHEMAHVTNGDMVTSALIQGTINAFVLVFARIISLILSRNNDNRDHNGSFFLIYMLMQTVLGFLGSLVVLWHSRQREYKADAGGAYHAGKANMIAALQKLQHHSEQSQHSALSKEFQAFGIVALAGLLATHPPIAKRIASLQALPNNPTP